MLGSPPLYSREVGAERVEACNRKFLVTPWSGGCEMMWRRMRGARAGRRRRKRRVAGLVLSLGTLAKRKPHVGEVLETDPGGVLRNLNFCSLGPGPCHCPRVRVAAAPL